TYLILMIFFPVYMMITGSAPSVVRASFMAILVALSLRLRWKINPIDGISLTCLLILIYNPYYAFHIGFQLSFLIAFSLIVSSVSIIQRYQTSMTQLLAVSILAQVVSFSTVIYHFHQISFLSLPVNLIYIPTISVIVLPLLLFLSFLQAIHFTFCFKLLAIPLSEFVHLFHELLLYLADFNHILIFGKLHWVLFLASIGLCLTVLVIWEQGNPFKGMLIWLAFCAFLYLLPYLNPYGEVTFIDVGQGDCILIRLPFQKKIILIDSGGRPVFGEREVWQERDAAFDVGTDIVVPYLKSRGIRSIDVLILTHGDYDHAGGASGILAEMKVKQLMLDRSLVQTELESRLIRIAVGKGTKVINARAGQSWGGDHYFFTILQALEVEEENDGSIILYAHIGGYKWLLTGDLEEAGERELLGNKVVPRIDVLKAGHHGSASSSSQVFLEKLNPSISIISAGVGNRYGHPNPEVVKRYEDLGIKMIRTDLNGTITYRYLWHQTGKWHVMLNGK
ncbi:MAG: DNA internalization-related competence protein ComEC/Rec2, partial [Anaerobacillus sp.]